MKTYYSTLISKLPKRKTTLLILLLFICHLFFRFYGLDQKSGFGWDQVDNAWAAKNILVDHSLPLVGMVAKQNSGFYIGPLYYYYVALFYGLTHLDPIASVFISGFTSILGFFVLYYVSKRLFSDKVALIALFFHTFSAFIISSDRVQWPVNFLAPVSLLVFYFLYRVITGKERSIVWLFLFLGISWQLNFTAIFFFLSTLFCLPFFPRTKKALIQIFLSVPVLIAFFIPNILYDLQHEGTSSNHLNSYVTTYFLGFHLRRFFQLAPDAFIEFAALFSNTIVKAARYLLLPVFFLLYLWKKRSREKILFCYITLLWFLIPWLVFSVYKGEISNYYFSSTRSITLMIIGYIIFWLFQRKLIVVNLGLTAMFVLYAFINTNEFFRPSDRPLFTMREDVKKRIGNGEVIPFVANDAESYLYYVLASYEKHPKDSSK